MLFSLLVWKKKVIFPAWYFNMHFRNTSFNAGNFTSIAFTIPVPVFDLGISFGKVKSGKRPEKVWIRYGNLSSKSRRNPAIIIFITPRTRGVCWPAMRFIRKQCALNTFPSRCCPDIFGRHFAVFRRECSWIATQRDPPDDGDLLALRQAPLPHPRGHLPVAGPPPHQQAQSEKLQVRRPLAGDPSSVTSQFEIARVWGWGVICCRFCDVHWEVAAVGSMLDLTDWSDAKTRPLRLEQWFLTAGAHAYPEGGEKGFKRESVPSNLFT